ncbi:MAG TPA: DUF3037 domain-containing protein [Acidobacteriaceae bacterium]|nr:DUF3037 domain-containing protein [Acidobacteriaceae bacterium]
MSERQQCEFFLVRYVPDPVKNEFVNIGVVLREAAEGGAAAVRFTRDWGRVRCADPDADIAMLEALEAEVRQRLGAQETSGKPLLEVMEDSFSNLIQMTEAKGCLAENMAAEMDALMRLYVEPRKERARQAVSARQAIVRSMRSSFERAGVWDLMWKRIPAAQYTRAGDPLKLDCGYRPNGVVRMFHAVSLMGDVEVAKVLAFSAPALRAGLERVEKAELELTAIVEPLRDGEGEVSGAAEAVEQYRFGVETMEAQQIRVLTVGDLGRVAEAARRELRV